MIVERINISFDHPPIPVRQFDYSAVFDSYSGEPDDPIGHGATAYQAVLNLLEQMETER